MKELVVNKKFNNKKLDVFLYDNFPTLTRNVLYKALRKKDILKLQDELTSKTNSNNIINFNKNKKKCKTTTNLVNAKIIDFNSRIK